MTRSNDTRSAMRRLSDHRMDLLRRACRYGMFRAILQAGRDEAAWDRLQEAVEQKEASLAKQARRIKRWRATKAARS